MHNVKNQCQVLREKGKNVPVGYRLCNQGHSGGRSIVVEKYTCVPQRVLVRIRLCRSQRIAVKCTCVHFRAMLVPWACSWWENGGEEAKCICAHKRAMVQAYV